MSLQRLIKRVNSAGWFTGRMVLDIKIENEFEGFSGKASETWEQRYTIELKCKDKKFKSIQVVSKHLSLDDVATMVEIEFFGGLLEL